jgi:hypothetical protein
MHGASSGYRGLGAPAGALVIGHFDADGAHVVYLPAELHGVRAPTFSFCRF